MKKLLFFMVLFCMMLTACASGDGGTNGGTANVKDSAGDDYGFSMNSESSEEDSNASNGDETKDAETAQKQDVAKDMLVYSSNISIDTLEWDKSVKNFKDMLADAGGFVETESMSDGSDTYSYYYIEENDKHKEYHASVRIPSSKYDGFLSGISEIGDIRNQESHVENMNQEYTDTKTTLKIYREQQKRLIAQIEKASDDYALRLQSELTELEIKIAKLQSRMNQIETDVAYSTVDIIIREVEKYSLHEKSDTFTMRISDAFRDSWKQFCNFLEGVLTVLIYTWYYIAFIVVIVLVIIHVDKKKKQKLLNRKLSENGALASPTSSDEKGSSK